MHNHLSFLHHGEGNLGVAVPRIHDESDEESDGSRNALQKHADIVDYLYGLPRRKKVLYYLLTLL